jgi:hypothetical protein
VITPAWQFINPLRNRPGPAKVELQLDPFDTEFRLDPYNDQGVILCQGERVFEARWVRSSDLPLDPKLKEKGHTGYWCWVSVSPYRERLVETSLELQRRNRKDCVIISQLTTGGGWAQVEYHDGVWTDIFGKSITDGPFFEGLVLKLPVKPVPRGKKVMGETGVVWQ